MIDLESHAGDDPAALPSARVVVPALMELIGPTSVLDVGCGSAAWLATFRAAGVSEVVGLDGAYARPQLHISDRDFREVDLTSPFDLGRSFDLVVSLEVAEHLPSSSARGLVRSIVRHGDLVLFSAAIPNQEGPGHVNLQWPAYWADMFAEHGYLPADILRDRFWADENVAWWYRQNMVLYGTLDRLASLGGPTRRPKPRRHPAMIAISPAPSDRRRLLAPVRALARRVVGRQ